MTKYKITLIILLIFNVILIYKFYTYNNEYGENNFNKMENNYEESLHLDTIAIQNWETGEEIILNPFKPLFLFIFSKYSCVSCVYKTIKFMKEHIPGSSEYYIISLDIDDYNYIYQNYIAYYNNIKLYKMTKIIYENKCNKELRSPAICILDKNKNIIRYKIIEVINDIDNDFALKNFIKFINNYNINAR